MSRIDEQLSYIERRKHCVKCPEYTILDAIVYESPVIATVLFGAIIMYRLNMPAMLIYILSCFVYLIVFTRFICTYCPLYGTTSCPGKFGNIAAKLFMKRDEKGFSRQFKTVIPLLSLLWFVPLIIGICLLAKGFSWLLFGIILAFVIFGFMVVPLISMFTVCRKCPVREDCPWMQIAK